MKKLFAIFCAVCLMPSFSAQAWIGGPFSNNSYGGQGGSDGIWEGVATGANLVGITRFAIGNVYPGIGSPATTAPANVVFPPGIVVTTPSISSGNAVIGAYGSQTTATFYFQGDFYATGTTFGSVSTASGSVFAVGSASDGANVLEFAYAGSLSGSGGFTYGGFMPSQRAFTAVGVAGITGTVAGEVPITVFGSKVSDSILLGL